jgi:hypothetical protein
MRKLLTCLLGMLFMFVLQAQVPNQLNYQGVARKANGHGIPNQTISVRLTIHDLSAAGPIVYRETRSVMTNAFGLFSIAIGSPGATGVIGTIASVNWGTGNKYLQVELDPDGGSSFVNLGATQLLSVPYALFAGGAPPVGPAGGDLTGTYPNPTVARIRGVNVTTVAPTTNSILGFDGTNWTPTSLATHPDNYWRMLGGNIYNANGGNVGIGTTTPSEKLQVNGNLKTLGFIMPTGAGAGKFLVSDASGVGSWTSTIAATSIVLPYKDSAASTTAHIFHIIQTSPTSATGALYGVTRSSGAGGFGTGGQVSSPSAPSSSAGVRGENLGNGVGVWGNSNNYFGVYGFSNNSSAVFGQSNSGAGFLAGVFGYATNYGGNGTFGYATRAYAYGALGISDSSAGVWGQTNAATYAATFNDGVGVYGVASAGGVGVYGNSFGFNAGKFENTNASNANDVLIATTNTSSVTPAAVHAINNPALISIAVKKGIWGEAYDGIGIFGTTYTGNGVEGASYSGIGTQGVSFTGLAGVVANHLDAGYGIYALSANGTAGRFILENPANGNNVLEAVTAGTGRSGFFQNTNPSNASTNVEITSNGTGRAIVARSNYPGFVNAGVVDALTTTYGGNALYGRATRAGAWGVYGLSDSSAGVAGVGYLKGSVGVLGQGWMGSGGQFVIDNTFPNSSNTVEVFNSQNGNGVVINLTNPSSPAIGLDIDHAGTGMGLHSNSNLGISGRFENTNASNNSTTLDVVSNGTGRAIVARSNFPGFVNAGVVDALTTTYGGNALYGRATRAGAWGVYGLSDSSAGVAGVGYLAGSVGVYGQGWIGGAGQFVIDNTFINTSNTVEVSNSQTGNGVVVNLTNASNTARGINVTHAGSGFAGYFNSNLGTAGKFENLNASNNSTTLEVISNGNGRAIFAQSNLPGPVNAGVIDAFAPVNSSNAIFGHATKPLGWGVIGVSDSSVGTAGIGYRAGSVGIYGQSYSGTSAQFVIDNSLVNTSNTVEISNSQTGKGLLLMMTNPANTANGIDVSHAGSGIGIHSTSNLGIAGRFENTNASNSSTTLDVRSNGTGSAIFAQSNLPGPVNAGVITGVSATYGSNAIFGHALRTFDWGVVGVADSSIGTVGIGYYAGSVGVFGQSYRGTAAQFVIDNSLPNTSNTVEVSNSQTGNGIVVNLVNAASVANAIDVTHAGNGNGIYSNSNLGIAGRFENLNASNANDLVLSTTNGLGRAVEGIVNNTSNTLAAVRGETNGVGYGVAGVGTNNNTFTSGVYGLHTGTNGNGVIGWGTKALTYGVIGHSDSSIAVYGESGLGNAGYFYSYGINNNVPTLYALNTGLSNVASFVSGNSNNTADAVTINRFGAGRSLFVNSSAYHNLMNFYDVVTTGNQTARVEGTAGLGLLAHTGGTFEHTVSSQRVGVGAYGQADSVGSQFNYGIVGNAKGGTLENAGVVGWIGAGASGTSVNAAIYGIALTGPSPRWAGYFDGDVQVTGTLSKGAGTFKIDHPQDPANKYLVHSFVESPDMMNVYNGNAVTDANGKAVVDLPGYFEAENKDFKYQLTVIGQFAQAIIGDEIKNNQFTILTDKPNVKVSWQVTGVRNDKFAQQHPVVAEVEKTGTEKGKYLYPELYGQSKESGISYMKNALPDFDKEGKPTNSARTDQQQNQAQKQVTEGVEQKRRMLANQTEQVSAQLKQTNANAQQTNSPTQQTRQVSSATQKSSVMFAQNTPQQANKTEQPADQKQIQLPTEKTKQILTMMDAKADTKKVTENTVTQQEPKNNSSQSMSDKSKQLSSSVANNQPGTNTTAANAATATTKPTATSSEKMKQLVKSIAPSTEQSTVKTIEKPKTINDSLTVTSASAQQAQQKTNSAGSVIENKKLNSAKLKLPTDQQKEGKKQ